LTAAEIPTLDWRELTPGAIVFAAMLALAVAALGLLVARWRQSKTHLIGGLLVYGLLILWGLGVTALYWRLRPDLGLRFVVYAALVPLVWPTAHLMGHETGRPVTGALKGVRALLTPAYAVAGAGLAGVLTLALFGLAEFKETPETKEFDGILRSSVPGMFLLVTGVAVYEELIFRMGFFVFLSRACRRFDRRGILAMLVSSMLWALAHTGLVDPAWVKYAQIFGFGLIQCVLFRICGGVEAPILSHVLFNAGIVILVLLADLVPAPAP
jgi:membrane protease YdiL (CAAX protease family)